jgi:hypothetical protein
MINSSSKINLSICKVTYTTTKLYEISKLQNHRQSVYTHVIYIFLSKFKNEEVQFIFRKSALEMKRCSLFLEIVLLIMNFIRFQNVDMQSIFRNSAFDNRLIHVHYIHKYLQQQKMIWTSKHKWNDGFHK